MFNAHLNDLEKEASSGVANPQMAPNGCSRSGWGCGEHFYGEAPAQELGPQRRVAGGSRSFGALWWHPLAIAHKAAELQLPRLSDGS